MLLLARCLKTKMRLQSLEFYTCGMARFGCCETFSGVLRTRWIRPCAEALATALCCATLLAQTPPVSQNEPIQPIHTLHVYTNLIQIPTLVLGPNRERINKPIAESRFSVSIDGGSWFRATHVRMEGDDSITLSILLDARGDVASLMPKINDAIANLAPLSLHSKDHVSIYTLDCELISYIRDAPVDSANLKRGVDEALKTWMERRQEKHRANCQRSVQLWDALNFVTTALSQLPGRRVVLVVSDGHDEGSKHSWSEVRTSAQANGVAVFGMSYLAPFAIASRIAYPRQSYENPFDSLCQLSGGMVFQTNVSALAESLKTFVTTLRERYIVEFPRPSNSTAGEHGMEVKVAKGDTYFIRSAGIAVPLPDAAVLADPTTVSTGPAKTPEMGSRRILTKPQ
jgi:hypothetical protein